MSGEQIFGPKPLQLVLSDVDPPPKEIEEEHNIKCECECQGAFGVFDLEEKVKTFPHPCPSLFEKMSQTCRYDKEVEIQKRVFDTILSLSKRFCSGASEGEFCPHFNNGETEFCDCCLRKKEMSLVCDEIGITDVVVSLVADYFC
jgi:hypothetical protein